MDSILYWENTSTMCNGRESGRKGKGAPMRRLPIILICCVFALALGLVACGGTSSNSASSSGTASTVAAPQDPDTEFMPALAAGLEDRWKYSDQTKDQELTVDKRKQLAQSELDHIAAFKGANFMDAELGKLAERYIAAVEDSIACLSVIDTDYIAFAQRWSDSYKERSLVIKELADKYGFKVSDEYQSSLNQVIDDAKVTEAEKVVPDDIRKAANEEIPVMLAGAFQKGDGGVYRATVANPTRANFDYYNFTVCLLDSRGGLIEQIPLGIENWASGAEASFEFTSTKEFASIGVINGAWWATWQS